MRIRTNQTHHDKVKDLFSPMIPIRLSLKNSQRYDHGKKVPKGTVFFLSTTVYLWKAEILNFLMVLFVFCDFEEISRFFLFFENDTFCTHEEYHTPDADLIVILLYLESSSDVDNFTIFNF